jgi:acetate kinase
MSTYVLTINGGSSSVKFALFETASMERKSAGSILSANSEHSAHGVLEWLKPIAEPQQVAAVGHRIVHGGPKFLEHARITPEMLAELRRLEPIDPDHLPGELALIESISKRLPDAAQVACFDTVFHRDLPQVAKLLPLPRKYEAAGVRRYGFHGLSYAYLMEELMRQAGTEVAHGRIVLAHLGAGASMAAVHEGKCIDTTMAFTPTAGLVMATRCGDLDPGVLVYLLRQEKMSADQLDELVNKRSGMLGVSGLTGDMRELLAARNKNSQAAEAVDLFCYQAGKWIGALAAALGGLDTLVFSGGIGENAAEVRSQICSRLGHLGVEIDSDRNRDAAAMISRDGGAAIVRVIKTDEEIMIARITKEIVGSKR